MNLSQLKKIWLANVIAAIAIKPKTLLAVIGKLTQTKQSADGCAHLALIKESGKSD